MINKEVRPIGSDNIGIIKRVLYPNEPAYKKELEMIINYFKQKGKKIEGREEPIVGIIFKKNNNNISKFEIKSMKRAQA